MASYPPRKHVLLQAIASLSPQVDRLCLVLNEYQEIPKELAQFKNLDPVIPEEDVKDIGKFYFPAEPDDFVALVDDDFRYPSDYIARAQDLCGQAGMDDNVFGYLGLAWKFKKQKNAHGWNFFSAMKETKHMMGVEILGTGVSFVLGKNMPDWDFAKGALGYADIRFGNWMYRQGLKAWALPKPADYLENLTDDALFETSLFNQFSMRQARELTGIWKERKIAAVAEMQSFLGKAEHINMRFESYQRKTRNSTA